MTFARRALDDGRTVMQDGGTQCPRGVGAATPHGTFPTAIRFTTRRAAMSTTATSLEGPFAVYAFVPSGLIATPHGRAPTGMVATTESRSTSTKASDPPRPVVTRSCLPSWVMV